MNFYIFQEVIYITVYVMFTLVILILGFLCRVKVSYGDNKKINGSQLYLFITFILFTFLMAFRSLSVGVDTSPYSRIYGIIINASSMKEAIKVAPLSAPIYIFICRIVSMISTNPQSMIIVSAIFVNLGLVIYIKRTSCDISLSTFCWIGLTLLYFSMNGNRQCMALVLILNALVYLTKNIKSVKGWCLITFAIGIHSTCLIIVFAIIGIILANKLRENRLIFITTFIGSVLISVIFKGIVQLFIRIFPRYVIYSNGTSKHSIFGSSGEGRIIILYIFLLVVCILWIYKNKKSSIDIDIFHSKLLPALVFGAVFGMFNSRNELVNRMLWFYISINISFIPAAIKQYKNNTRLILKLGIIVILGSYSVLSLLENQNGVVPYILFWR